MRESPAALQAWSDYLALGDGRSLDALLHRYQTATEPPPTRREKTLKDWSRAHDWQGRLKRLAQEQADRIAAEMEARRREIMGAGLALDFERVAVLGDLARSLLDDYQLWVDDVKLAANGDQVAVKRFNDAELRELRGLLDDLAKETGGRRKSVDVTSGGEALPVIIRTITAVLPPKPEPSE